MAFLKAKWILMVIGAVCLLSLGVAGMALVGGADQEQKMRDIQGLLSTVQRLRGDPANKQTIEARRQEREEQKAEFDRMMAAALDMQKNNVFYEEIDAGGNIIHKPRELLVPGVLPNAKSAVRIQFTEAYRQEFGKLKHKLRARGRPTIAEIQRQEIELEQRNRPQDEQPLNPWMPQSASTGDEEGASAQHRNLSELLRSHAPARAADWVARSIYMYVDDNALGMHELASRERAPTSVEIWQAQMSLWIQQDIATALARCNEQRAEQLRQRGEDEPFWVGQMPVKRLVKLCIADVLGRGGGSNVCSYADSFTGVENNEQMFMVPLQLVLEIEEAALMDVLDKLCSVGFYTPICVQHKAVAPEPLFLKVNQLYIYGEEPVIEVTIDLEGYYFRQVFEEWIPSALKPILKRPGAREAPGGRG
ncbi:MAG: hypothetical protein JXQ75_09995 [Phycisphaerae bacterium]|nr:hypothetical protein [Phycisphaerae bacterium]